MTDFLVAGGIMGSIGVSLAAVLAFADKKLYVYEDPRIDEVENMLPKANCGACGCVGCHDFAEKLVNNQTVPAKCSVSSADGILAIATFLQIDAGTSEKRVARLACAGGPHVARHRAQYFGLPTCRAAAIVNGGAKGCSWGCLGLGDCERVCDFNAISMNSHSLPVITESLCTACGDCVDICPKQLFSIHAASHQLWVACRSLADGQQAEAECEVACTACGRCATDAPPRGLGRVAESF
ncbi:MAG: 4Fe-4S binding protein [Acidobacteria bacterium]|nr:4Fe-4S binding protein [Acidobacteriota bacterium]